jgi:hypothetical protein
VEGNDVSSKNAGTVFGKATAIPTIEWRPESALYSVLRNDKRFFLDGATHSWDWPHSCVLPLECLLLERLAIDIEHDNSNTRHHLRRFTQRRTEGVSQLEHMADITIRI